MCVTSAIMTYETNRWDRQWPGWAGASTFPQTVTREEFDALRNDVRELKELLAQAQKFDAATGQPECELEEKVELVRKMAQFVGIDLDDVLGAHTP